jgi:phospholipid/cholesterol/gamma-HCH transport system substrate-binding protein
MDKKRINDFKIGLLVVVALAFLLALTLKVSKFSLPGSGYELDLTFINSSGIEKNAPVRLSGVEAGKVKDIRLVYGPEGTHVLLALWLNQKARVRKDSEAFVATLGLMGEKYVEVTAGSAASPFLAPKSTIVGREPFDTAKFLEKSEEIAEDLDQAISDVRQLTGGVNDVIVVHREKLDQMLKNFVETSENMKAFTEDIRQNPWKLLSKPKTRRSRKKKK